MFTKKAENSHRHKDLSLFAYLFSQFEVITGYCTCARRSKPVLTSLDIELRMSEEPLET